MAVKPDKLLALFSVTGSWTLMISNFLDYCCDGGEHILCFLLHLITYEQSLG